MQKECQKKKKRKKRKCSEVMKEEEWKWERKSGEAKGEDGQPVRYRAVTGWYRQTVHTVRRERQRPEIQVLNYFRVV